MPFWCPPHPSFSSPGTQPAPLCFSPRLQLAVTSSTWQNPLLSLPQGNRLLSTFFFLFCSRAGTPVGLKLWGNLHTKHNKQRNPHHHSIIPRPLHVYLSPYITSSQHPLPCFPGTFTQRPFPPGPPTLFLSYIYASKPLVRLHPPTHVLSSLAAPCLSGYSFYNPHFFHSVSNTQFLLQGPEDILRVYLSHVSLHHTLV